ncbi:hypothetical protein [Nostoc sp. UHCC 0870]|uniref:hypothetical protein n=1 Tax=Nostoc sp. UHCC 0870 TaxID=2914041 RepID=UPI001EDE7F04|nr:hypothetical protein [Nostoc sp. UHCC 0870]UKO95745.1 hypothetical protein L6494_13745 [Nostoc sp. UHCC 0870]
MIINVNRQAVVELFNSDDTNEAGSFCMVAIASVLIVGAILILLAGVSKLLHTRKEVSSTTQNSQEIILIL